MDLNYYVGQGRVLVGARDASGNPLGLRWLGNVSKLALGLKTDTLEHKESHSGQRQTDLRIVIGKACSANMTLEDVGADNLALALFGQKVTVNSGTVTGEVLPDNLAVDSVARLANPKVSSVVIKDSTGAPLTLTAGTNYRLNADHGSIDILDLTTGGPFTQPLKADYSYDARVDVAMFNQAGAEVFLRFEGLNLADTNQPVLVELYRFASDPLKNLDLLGEKLAELELEGSVLLDPTKASDATLGQFGRVTRL